MLAAMRRAKSQKHRSQSDPDNMIDWSSVVNQLAKEANQRLKTFYRRVKPTLPRPPAQSTLPTPARKIQRILQQTTPWSSRALYIIP